MMNLLEEKKFKKLPKNVDLLIHFAANARVYELVKKPELALENIIITFHVLEFARKNRIKKIIFSSSREVYGNLTEENLIAEDKVKIENCESPYSASKITAEVLIQTYKKVYGIAGVIKIIEKFDDIKSKILIKENRPGEVWKFQANISKARRLLGCNPKIDINNGLARTVEWYKNFYGGSK